MNLHQYHKISLFILVLVALGITYLLFMPFFNTIIVSLIVYTIIHPLYVLCLPYMSEKKASLFIIISLVLFILLPILFLSKVLLEQVQYYSIAIYEWLKSGGDKQIHDFLQNINFIPEAYRQYVDIDYITTEKIIDYVKTYGLVTSKNAVVIVKDFIGDIFIVLLKLFVGLFFIFTFFIHGEKIRSIVKKSIPLDNDLKNKIVKNFADVSRSLFLGSIGSGIAQGITTGIGLAICGISPWFWGFVAIIASFVPIIGIACIVIPTCIFLFVTGKVYFAIFLGIWWLLVISTIDNFIRPLIIGKTTNMSGIWILFSIIGGLSLFGAIGILYGPILLSMIALIIATYIETIKEMK